MGPPDCGDLVCPGDRLDGHDRLGKSGEPGNSDSAGPGLCAKHSRNAEKSARSANEIDVITGTLAAQSIDVRKAITDGLGYLASSQDKVDRVADILHATNGSVGEVGRGLDTIASATDEQRRDSAEVAHNIDAIAAMARQNNVAVEQTATSAQSLDNLAQGLQSTVSRFKV